MDHPPAVAASPIFDVGQRRGRKTRASKQGMEYSITRIHPLGSQMMKCWISDTCDPVVTEISIDGIPESRNRFNYDSLREMAGYIEHVNGPDTIGYKIMHSEKNIVVLDYIENSGGTLTEHYEIKLETLNRSIMIDARAVDTVVLRLLSIHDCTQRPNASEPAFPDR